MRPSITQNPTLNETIAAAGCLSRGPPASSFNSHSAVPAKGRSGRQYRRMKRWRTQMNLGPFLGRLGTLAGAALSLSCLFTAPAQQNGSGVRFEVSFPGSDPHDPT